jgi:M6 family metalloprotease-like protein
MRMTIPRVLVFLVLVFLSSLSSVAEAQPVGPFGYGVVKRTPTAGARETLPVVVALVDYTDQRFSPTHTPAYFRQLMSGPGVPNVRDYFAENSGGTLRLDLANVVGPFTMPDDPSTPTADESRLACINVMTCPGTRLTAPGWMRSVVAREVGARINLRAFDRNNDGSVGENELLLIIIQAAPNPVSSLWGKWGGTRGLPSGCVNVGSGVTATRLCRQSVPDIQEHAGFQTLTHEVLHGLGLRYDYYGPWDRSALNMNATVMGPSVYLEPDRRETIDLDAWHRMRFGWTRPRVVDIARSGACMRLDASHVGGGMPSPNRDPIVVFDSRRGNSEFFVIEHRARSREGTPAMQTPASLYDADVFGSGLVVWNIRTNNDQNTAVDDFAVRAFQNTQGVFSPLEARPAPMSDDTVRGQYLEWGADGRLQTTPVGADTLARIASVFALGLGPVNPATPGILRTNDPGRMVAIRREHRGVQLYWPGRVPAGVTLSSGPDNDTTRAVLLSIPGLKTTGDADCINEATPLPDRAARASVVSPAGFGGTCFERATVAAPTKTDPSARALAKPSLTVPIEIRFGGKVSEATPILVRVHSRNATASRTSFVAPIGTTRETFDLTTTESEPYAVLSADVELTRRDYRLASTYTERHELRYMLTPDQSMSATDQGITCSSLKAIEMHSRELLVLTRDSIRPPPLPDPDPMGDLTLADLARADGPLSKHAFFTEPFLMPKAIVDGVLKGALTPQSPLTPTLPADVLPPVPSKVPKVLPVKK